MTRFLLHSLIVFWAVYPGTICAQTLLAPFVGTPPNVVEAMLDLADVSPADYLIDLGSGDGRIVIAAAKRGAAGHGVDIDAELVELSIENASKAGVDDRVMFFEEDIFETDFSMASVVTIYMSQQVNRDLKPHFLENMMPGSRVISHIFDMGDWKPDLFKEMGRHTIYGWIIPARIDGEWVWSSHGNSIRMDICQTYQTITNAVVIDERNTSFQVELAEINGDRVTFILRDEGHSVRTVYNGKVADNFIHGTQKIIQNGTVRHYPWKAAMIN